MPSPNIRAASDVAWPFYVIAPSMLLFVFGLTLREGAGEILSMLGMMGTATGSLLFLQNISDHWESWAYEWAPPAPTAASVLVLPFFLNMGVHTQKGVGP